MVSRFQGRERVIQVARIGTKKFLEEPSHGRTYVVESHDISPVAAHLPKKGTTVDETVKGNVINRYQKAEPSISEFIHPVIH